MESFVQVIRCRSVVQFWPQQLGELPAVQIDTADGPLVLELVTGGRGAALALVDELTAA